MSLLFISYRLKRSIREKNRKVILKQTHILDIMDLSILRTNPNYSNEGRFYLGNILVERKM
uniref:Uncharacterized protein n=1 Tax=Lepeophtheirus salmonis TaxID=72036 RepID=A0A0K2UNT8_LEPSM